MRQDYISLRMDEFGQWLAHIAQVKKEARWSEAAEIVGKRLRRLLGRPTSAFVKLMESDLLAALVSKGPTLWVPYKMIMLIALLKEAGDVATARYPPRGGHGWYLKALHLLLDALIHQELGHYSELAPGIETLLIALGDSPLPVRTRLRLIREYDRRGCFRQVRDEFVIALARAPKNSSLLNFGIALFERLGHENYATLVGGGMRRSELEATLAELLARKRA